MQSLNAGYDRLCSCFPAFPDCCTRSLFIDRIAAAAADWRDTIRSPHPPPSPVYGGGGGSGGGGSGGSGGDRLLQYLGPFAAVDLPPARPDDIQPVPAPGREAVRRQLERPTGATFPTATAAEDYDDDSAVAATHGLIWHGPDATGCGPTSDSDSDELCHDSDIGSPQDSDGSRRPGAPRRPLRHTAATRATHRGEADYPTSRGCGGAGGGGCGGGRDEFVGWGDSEEGRGDSEEGESVTSPCAEWLPAAVTAGGRPLLDSLADTETCRFDHSESMHP